MNKINWLNPYKSKGRFWVKGNLHTHSKLSDGGLTYFELVRAYEKMGYGFIAITDHDIMPTPYKTGSNFIVIPGIEAQFANISQSRHHTCIFNTTVKSIKYNTTYLQQKLIDLNSKKGALIILAHPDWETKEHYPIDELFSLKNFTGIEIYNSVIEILQGSPLSTAKWDRLLSAGRKVLGFANQDTHSARTIVDCCNVVRTNKAGIKSIFKSLISGNFYCYYGVNILDIGRNKNKIYVKTKNAKLIRFVGFEGRILKKSKGKNAEIEFTDKPAYKYIRIECLGIGEEISWSQPFFRE